MTHPAYGVLRPVSGYASVLLAGNPSPMTLEGTNTWLLRAPGAPACVVVDPGPDDKAHLSAVAAAGPVTGILLTHGHADHSAGARRLHELTGAPVRALDPAHRYGAEGLGDGDVVAAAVVEVRVLGTPGHTSDSLCFLASGPGGDPAVLTGDTVLGRGTTVVAHPDGQLGAYLDSLDRLHALAESHEIDTVWPGHGPVIDDALGALDYYIAHRQERLQQVGDALAELRSRPHPEGIAADELPRQVVEIVYADVDPVLWGAAELSVRAQMQYLASRG